jgi:MoxR-like ATPase
MAIDANIIKTAHKLNKQVHENSAEYYHSRPIAISQAGIVLPGKTKHCFNIAYDLKDLLFIGAITESPVLLTGGTDLGKTTLAKLVMNALFGNQFHRLDFDNDFGKDTYSNVNSDFFQESGKTLEDLYSIYDWMKLPGFIADELNRAHAQIATKALHIIKEKDVTLPNGKRAQIGHQLPNGGTYQYQIATINEGQDYKGVFPIDKALRRRTTIEFPMDVFPLTPKDRLLIKRAKEKSYGLELRNNENRLENLLAVYNGIDDIKMHPVAEMFLAYLEAFDFCKNSVTKDKGSVVAANGSYDHICSKPVQLGGQEQQAGVGCPFIRAFESEFLCARVRGLTPGISKNLVTVAKGFALLRATKFVEMIAGYFNGGTQKPLSYSINKPEEFVKSLRDYTGAQDIPEAELGKKAVEKYFAELEIEKADIEAAVGFVGYSKINIAPAWVAKSYHGNKFEAVNVFVENATRKFEEGLARCEVGVVEKILQGNASEDEMVKVEKYCCEKNPWLWRVILPYVVNGNHELVESDEEAIDQLYGE